MSEWDNRASKQKFDRIKNLHLCSKKSIKISFFNVNNFCLTINRPPNRKFRGVFVSYLQTFFEFLPLPELTAR